MEQQNFKNHTQVVKGFVFFVLPVLTLNVGWSLYQWRRLEFSWAGLERVLVAATLLVLAMYARTFALRVQDRVIRLEERLRYERVLPADLLARAGELSLAQIVSLRFASDGELPGLMREVLEQRVAERKVIKAKIREWRGDYLRA